MKCANCGGEIHFNENCKDCGIGYDEMIRNISHPEMKRLFKRMGELQEEHRDITLEESLMACEFENSSLIIAGQRDDDGQGVLATLGPDDKPYIALFTDLEEFNREENDFDPLPNSWNVIMELLKENVNGFVINLYDVPAFIPRGYIDRYFGGE